MFLSVIIIAFLGFVLASVEINKEETFYQTKTTLNKFMKFVFAGVFFIGIYLQYDSNAKVLRVCYQNNVPYEKFEKAVRAKFFYEEFAIEELKRTDVKRMIQKGE